MTRAEAEAKHGKLQWRHTLGPDGGTSSGDWLGFETWRSVDYCSVFPPLVRFPKVDGDRS